VKVRLSKNGPYWLARWSQAGRTKGKSLGRRDDVDPKQALALCQDLESALKRGVNGPETPHESLSAWISQFLALRPEICERTAGMYAACGARLVDFLGANTEIGKICALDAKRFRAHLIGHLGNATVFRICSEARSIFQEAVDCELIERNPFAKAVPKKPRRDAKWQIIDLDTLERLFSVAPMDCGLLLGLVRLAGLRQAEALRLMWLNVDLGRRRILVAHAGDYETTKGRTREVPIRPRLHDLLFEASMGGGDEQRVLAGMRRGSLWRAFRTLCARANIEPWPQWCQAMRRSCQTEWAGQYPLHVVAEWLGNSPKIAMRHYLRATDGDFEAVSGELALNSGPAESSARAWPRGTSTSRTRRSTSGR